MYSVKDRMVEYKQNLADHISRMDEARLPKLGLQQAKTGRKKTIVTVKKEMELCSWTRLKCAIRQLKKETMHFS
jgi:hypothetical protein